MLTYLNIIHYRLRCEAIFSYTYNTMSFLVIKIYVSLCSIVIYQSKKKGKKTVDHITIMIVIFVITPLD